MKAQQFDAPTLLYLLLFGMLLLIGVRFLAVFRFLLLPLIAGLLVLGAVHLIWHYYQKRRTERAFRATTAGIIQTRLEECDAQIEANKAEIADIQSNITELEQQLAQADALSSTIVTETRQLIGRFRGQLQLRKSKLSFFENCRLRLLQLLQQHQLSEALAVKKEKLRLLQENNYDDLAKMEALRSNLEMDTLYLDTIESLSQRVQLSNTYDDAERLRAELDDMTRSIQQQE